MNTKAEKINNGLQGVEKLLQQKSENIAKAKESQKVTSPNSLVPVGRAWPYLESVRGPFPSLCS